MKNKRYFHVYLENFEATSLSALIIITCVLVMVGCNQGSFTITQLMAILWGGKESEPALEGGGGLVAIDPLPPIQLEALDKLHVTGM